MRFRGGHPALTNPATHSWEQHVRRHQFQQVERVNDTLTKKELDAVRLSAQRGRPLGDDVWVESIATRLNLESTICPRGRQQIKSQQEAPIKGG